MVPTSNRARTKTRRKRILRSGAAALLLVLGVLVAGCDPPLDPKKYGEILTDMPQVEGAEEAYPLPQLDEPQEAGTPDKK